MAILQSIPLAYYVFSALLNFIICFCIAVFVFLKNPRSNLNRTFSIFLLSISQWSIFYFLWLSTRNLQLADFFMRTCMIGVIFIPPTFTHFVLVLVGRKENKILFRVNYLIALVLASTVYFSFFARQGNAFHIFPYWLLPGKLFPVHLVHFFVNLVYSYFLISKTLKYNKGLFREQVRYVFLGTIVGFIGGWTNYIYWYRIPYIPPFLNIAVAFEAPFIAYAIVRYRLLDIRVAVTRTGVLLFVYGVVFGMPLIVAYGFKEYLQTALNNRWWIPPVVLYGILSTFAPFIYIFMQRKAEDRILKEQRRTQEALIRIFKHITKVRELDKLVKLIAKLLTRVLKVEHSAVFLFDRRRLQYHLAGSKGSLSYFQETILPGNSLLIKYIQRHRDPLVYEELESSGQNSQEVKEVASLMHNISAQVIVPSFIKDNLLGFAILGNKSSGEIYTQQDLLTLSIISDKFALAIEYAQFLKEYEAVQAKLREAEKLKGIAQLMHSLNHELRNIFNNMFMPLQFIMMGEIDINDKNKLDENLNKMAAAVDTGVEILDYVQAYINKAKSDEIKSKSLEESIDKAVAHFTQKFKEANITLIKQIQPNLPTIQGRDAFDDMFKNILANCYFALTDQPRAQKLIDIEAKLLDDKNTIQIKVSDTGPDMTKSSYQTDKDSPFKERGKLGGVNLFLAYIIANDHKGTLTTESYPKGGTTFVLNIPVTQ